MNVLASWLLAAAAVGPPAPQARLDGIALVRFEGSLALRVNYTGRPGLPTVTRAGSVARVTLPRTDLGWRFGAGRRFEWSPSAAPLASFASAERTIERLRVEAAGGESSLVFELPSDVSIELRRARSALIVVLRQRPPTLVAQAPSAVPPTGEPPAPKAAPTEDVAPLAAPLEAPARTAEATASEPPPALAAVPEAALAEPVLAADEPPAARVVEPAPAAPFTPTPTAPVAATPVAAGEAVTTADLYRQLFPPADDPALGGDDTATLYARLFPTAATAAAASGEDLGSGDAGPEAPEGLRLGPFRLRPYFTLSYIDAEASLLESPEVVGDRYFQIEPGVVARAPLGLGSVRAEYAPAFRAGAGFAATQDSSHVLSATLELPVGADSQITLQDRFVVSTLDTREADPGGEYFFDLARFSRNQFSANARLSVGPRLYAEMGGAMSHLTFDEAGGFFGYDHRSVTAGLGYELSPTLRATLSYVYDLVPEPEDRPEAESTASSALLTLQGDLLPLLTGRLALGYRDQESPNTAAEGRRFRGFVMQGSLTREFGRESAFSLLLNRSTPVSSFEQNAFYVNTSVVATLSAPLPASLALETGVGFAWNDYEIPALQLGVPREDTLFSLYAGLRRDLGERLWASAYYRRERRRSNLDSLDTTSDGLLVQVSWGLFGPGR